MAAPPALANVLRPHGDFAIIGPGGGVDVLRAVANGSRSVTGIEINPIIATTIMRERYADYSLPSLRAARRRHSRYRWPIVPVRNAKHFDVVQMTLVDTWASTAAGAFALSENNLYTVEAFREYFEHLKPDGMVAITRWEFRHPREALTRGFGRDGGAASAWESPILREISSSLPRAISMKTAFRCRAGQKDFFHARGRDGRAQHLDSTSELEPLYLPSHPGNNTFSDSSRATIPMHSPTYAYNVAPVTDNAPFFFFTLNLADS